MVIVIVSLAACRRTGADVNSGHAILKATEALIGAKDTLQLEMSAVDQVRTAHHAFCAGTCMHDRARS